MARLGLGAPPPPPNHGNEVEYIAWFRFPVTWTYLSSPVPEVQPVSPIKPVSTPTSTLMTLVSTAPAPPLPVPVALDTAVLAGNSRPAASTAQWEMVIPKMSRPLPKPVVDRLPAPPPPATISSAPASANDSASAEYVPPSLLQFTPDETFLVRFWRHIALAAIALLALGFLLRGGAGTNASPHKLPAEWSHRYASPPGRLLSLYEPSRGESDYSLEFAWVPDAKGAGWVLRARDDNNYYATRLTLQKPAPNLTLAEEHFSVLAGVEGTHSRKVIPLGNHPGPVQIQMDAIGPAFTLSLQGNPVDYWNDARLNSGGLGFFDETGARPEVERLRFTFIKKGATRTAVASLP